VKFVLLLLTAIPLFAGEYAVLSSGMRIRIERHERVGDMMRLIDKDAITELPASVIASFEIEEYVPPPPPPIVPPAPAAPPPAPAPARSKDPRILVHEAAVRNGLPPKFVESVARVESNLRQDAVSPKGATGVMQLMPGTAKMLAADEKDLEQNIDAGTRHLRDLLIKYNGDVVKALAAYNAGAGAVDRYRGIPPYRETQDYVNKVINKYQKAGGQ
jgi:soluble lytic murein transglycosylase-like protein